MRADLRTHSVAGLGVTRDLVFHTGPFWHLYFKCGCYFVFMLEAKKRIKKKESFVKKANPLSDMKMWPALESKEKFGVTPNYPEAPHQWNTKPCARRCQTKNFVVSQEE